MSSSLNHTVINLVREVLPRRFLKASLEKDMALREDLGIDSIGLMSLAFRLEEEFNLDLMASAEEFTKVQTIEDLQKFVYQLM